MNKEHRLAIIKKIIENFVEDEFRKTYPLSTNIVHNIATTIDHALFYDGIDQRLMPDNALEANRNFMREASGHKGA